MEFAVSDMMKSELMKGLQGVAEKDAVFAEKLKDPNKTIEDCCRYIVKMALKSINEHKGAQGGVMTPAEVQGHAMHYYDEPELTKVEIEEPVEVKSTIAKTTGKGKKDTPKPPKNVLDITRAITASTGEKKGQRPKDNLNAGFVPMERPDTLKDAKKGSKAQAKSIVQMDLFAFDEDED